MIVKTEAIVLKSIKYSDTSKIISLFSSDFGRITLIAKGARQTKSKFGAALEPMSVSNVCFYMKSTKDLYTLSGADNVLIFNNILNSLESIGCGMMILESVIQTLIEHETNKNLYVLLKNSLIKINNSKSDYFSIFCKFQLELSHNLGFSMKFDLDNINNKSKSNDVLYSIENGYIVNEYEDKSKHIFRFDNEVINIINKIDSEELETVNKINIPVSFRKQIKDFFISYFSYHLEKPFGYKSFRLLK
ncbi:MAG: DNA repair protein RecO [Ignavibacteriae bacterium]|nr:DNA repair protein RecO [Ignavibacteriota bacterium]